MAVVRACHRSLAAQNEQRGFTLVELVLVGVILGLIAAVAVPVYNGQVERARMSQTIADIGTIQLAVTRFQARTGGNFPEALADVGLDALRDPWGNPYRYLNVETAANPGVVRKDRNLVPLNSDYDLYSMGSDGDSRPPLTAGVSRDDIIRANNGLFIGRAEDY